MVNDNPKKNIYKCESNKWRIQKEHDGKTYYFGRYHKLEDAMKVRDLLETINYGFVLDPMRNITQMSNGRWYLRKYRDGVSIYNGSFDTLEEAQKERDYMESVNWEWELTNGNGEISEEELINGSDWIRPHKGISEKRYDNDFHFPKGVTKRHFR